MQWQIANIWYWLKFVLVQGKLNETETEMNTLKRTLTEKDEETRKRQSLLDAKLIELENIKNNIGKYRFFNIKPFLCEFSKEVRNRTN